MLYHIQIGLSYGVVELSFFLLGSCSRFINTLDMFTSYIWIIEGKQNVITIYK